MVPCSFFLEGIGEKMSGVRFGWRIRILDPRFGDIVVVVVLPRGGGRRRK